MIDNLDIFIEDSLASYGNTFIVRAVKCVNGICKRISLDEISKVKKEQLLVTLYAKADDGTIQAMIDFTKPQYAKLCVENILNKDIIKVEEEEVEYLNKMIKIWEDNEC
jgi:hypothetical protein